jgi:hypothetical protein
MPREAIWHGDAWLLYSSRYARIPAMEDVRYRRLV